MPGNWPGLRGRAQGRPGELAGEGRRPIDNERLIRERENRIENNRSTNIVNNNNRNINRNDVFVNNNYHGAGWNGGNWGLGSGRGLGYGYRGGWARPYYGNWYQGGWGGNGFWTGLGVGAMSMWGLGSLGGILNSPGYAYGNTLGFPVGSYGMYNYFPTWGIGNYASWGLGPMASNAYYSGYADPYYTSPPDPSAVVYDYSRPIDVAAPPPEPAIVTSTEQLFANARDAFKAGDYPRALDLTDQALRKTPNVPVMHEFRALTLFALKRYNEAASVLYAVLSAEPGWNWSTMIGLYPDVDTYTNHLRALEADSKTNPDSASDAFLLGYYYMVQGNSSEAAAEFDRVVQLQPKDKLSSSFAQVLKKAGDASPEPNEPAPAPEEPTPAVANAEPQPQPEPAPPPQPEAAGTQAKNETPANADNKADGEPAPPAPPPPPAALTGEWKAKPSDDVAIDLTLSKDGAFTWVVDKKGQKQTIEGTAGFKDGNLALLQENGPPLVGKVTQSDANSFEFRPPNAPDNAPPLKFTH
ncbi:tetratricopeptide repeat protein [Singulisphaera sp. PoT]|uniref:tetratricopeptide repeat protein n=1 Tax=Singulisphaera sp. PoT TaxID=3411797 RepID=UPI003BF50982